MDDSKQRVAFTMFLIFATIFGVWGIFTFTRLAKADDDGQPTQVVVEPEVRELTEVLDETADPLAGLGTSEEEKAKAKTDEQRWLEREMLHGEMFDSILSHMVMCRKRSDGQRLYMRSCRTAKPLGCEDRIYTFVGYLLDAAEKYDLDPWLLAGMAYNESRFNPYAVGPTVGSKGILQLHPRSKRGRASKFVKSPWYRTKCMRESGNCQADIVDKGADHIKKSIAYCGSLEKGLSQYNTGKCDIRRIYVRRTLRTVKSLKSGHKAIRWCDQPRKRH